MKNSFQKVLIRLLLIVLIAVVWAMYVRGWNVGNFESFLNLTLSKGKYVLMGIGVFAVFFAKTKHI